MDLQQLRHHLTKVENLSEVERETNVSRTTLYNVMKNESAHKETVEKLSKYFTEKNNQELYENLRFYGAPLAESRRRTIPLEETLLRAFELSRNDALVESVLPYVLYKNRSTLKLGELYRSCVQEKLDRHFGYYLSMSEAFHSFPKYAAFLNHMRFVFNYSSGDPVPLANREVPDYAKSRFLKNKVALAWGLMAQGETSHHLERFHKWEKSES